jgi:hypothetical protein
VASHRVFYPLLPFFARKQKIFFVSLASGGNKIPKTHRYTLALKIDGLFIEIIEMTASAAFVKKQDKLPYLRAAIRKLDTLKILLQILWETGSLVAKEYLRLGAPLSDVGKMLGGWLGQVEKQQEKENSPEK